MGGCASTGSPKISLPPVATRVEADRAKDVRQRVCAAVLDMPTELVALVVGYCDLSFLGRLRDFETMLNDADMDGFACAVATAYQPVYVIHVPMKYESRSLGALGDTTTAATDAALKRYVGIESRILGLTPTPAVVEKSKRFVALLRELLHDFPAARLYAASGFAANGSPTGIVDRSLREFWIEHAANLIASAPATWTSPTTTTIPAPLPTAHNHAFPFGVAAAVGHDREKSPLVDDVPAILTSELGKMRYSLDRDIPTPRIGARLPAVLEHKPLHWVYGAEFKRTSYSVCGCLFRVRRVALP